MAIHVTRIDDGRRAKIVCTGCGREAYLLLLPDGKEAPIEGVIEELESARDNHRCSG